MYYQLLFLDTKAPLCLPVSYYYTYFLTIQLDENFTR